MLQTDAVIIGAGPVGLFAIFELGMMKIKCHVIDPLDKLGGQCSVLYPEKPIYDIPGFPQIYAQDLIANLIKQAAPFQPVYHLQQQVDGIKKNTENNQWQITTSNNINISAKVIIIAAGVGGFQPKKLLIENITKYEKNYVHYFVKNQETYRDKVLIIAGGGDSAVDWVLALHKIAKKIYVVHRRDHFRAALDSVQKMHDLANNNDKINMIIPYQLYSLQGNEQIMHSVIVKDFSGHTKQLQADYLLPFFGLSAQLGPIAKWGLNVQNKHIVVDPATSLSNIDGIFAIGDIASYPNKLKLILTGFAEAAQAAHKARELIYPNQKFHFEYSTISGVK